MALVSVKDFGLALNISGGTIRSKISRRQLCCNRKGLIDTEHPLNYVYLLEVNGGIQSVFDIYNINKTNVGKKNVTPTKNVTNVSSLLQKDVVVVENAVVLEKSISNKPNEIKASIKVAPTVKPKKEVVIKEPVLSAEEKRIRKEQEEQRQSFLQIEIRKKLADVKLQERKAELSQIELEKKAGNTLPLDLVRKIEVINFQSILNTFLLEAKNMATVMVEKFGGTRTDVVEIETKLNQIFKRTVETTKKNIEKEIENAVLEFSEVRSRGERK